MKISTVDNLNQKLDTLFDPASYQGHNWAEQYKVAGLNLIEEINQLDPDLVIDAGCAHNRFKGHIQNLIGFDRNHFPFADLYTDIEDAPFRSESADVVLALGSLHFGNKVSLEQQLDRVVSWVKPGGFVVMRVNHKIHYNDTFRDIRYNWSIEDLKYFTEKFNLIIHLEPVIESKYENNILMAEKMVWWWKKPGERNRYKIDPVTCQLIKR